jgi:hypothetical protein
MIAKFKLVAKTDYGIGKPGEVTSSQVVFTPVASGSEENKTFWKYTPSGKLEMQIDNPLAVAGLRLGAEYYLEFTEVNPHDEAPIKLSSDIGG